MQPGVGSKRWIGSLAAGFATLVAGRTAVACSCLASSVESSYQQSSDVLSASALPRECVPLVKEGQACGGFRPAWTRCRWLCDNAPAGCSSDADCAPTGCSGQICAAQPLVTTCVFRSEYACYQDPAITTCGCHAGECAWDATDALKQCLADAAPSAP